MIQPDSHSRQTILTVFGTRPECIKLAPILKELARVNHLWTSRVVCTGQHSDLLKPMLELFQVQLDHQWDLMRPGQSLNQLLSRIVCEMDRLLEDNPPSVVLVQGDTTTALGATLAAFQRRIPVGHIEAGLRTNTPHSPFPEEMNRRLISRMAQWHFASTKQNVRSLRREGVPTDHIFRTGNPIVDALQSISQSCLPSATIQKLIEDTADQKRLIITMHRRENFHQYLEESFRVIRSFVERHRDVSVIFPLHPNPIMREKAYSTLQDDPNIHLIEPLGYTDFIHLLKSCWLIASDSGGIQEEAPSLGKPLLILRESTERPEVMDTGLAQLVPNAQLFAEYLEEAYQNPVKYDASQPNPFGDGRASKRIVRTLTRLLSPTLQTSPMITAENAG